jgi:hypothetical protein
MMIWTRGAVAALNARCANLLLTIRSYRDGNAGRKIADNITFEGYRA